MHTYYESRKRARKNWRQSEKGKAWDKAYSKRDYVKAKAHEKYINKKIRDASNEKSDWGGKRSESKAILKNHYEWCKENGRDTSWYQVASNECLNTENSERFVNYEKETRQ